MLAEEDLNGMKPLRLLEADQPLVLFKEKAKQTLFVLKVTSGDVLHS
jgi:hypothetical protein